VTSTEALSRGLFVTAAHLVIVTIAIVVGQILVRLCNPPPQFRNLFLVAIWNNNGTSLPTILVTAVILYAKDLFEGDDAAERGLSYIAFYALTYQLLAWTLGMHMMQSAKDGSVALLKKVEGEASESVGPSTVENALKLAVDQRAAAAGLAGSGDGAAANNYSIRLSNGSINGSANINDLEQGGHSKKGGPSQSASQTGVSGAPKLTVCQFIRKKVLVPPVCAVLAGMVVGLTPFLHDNFVAPAGALYFIYQVSVLQAQQLILIHTNVTNTDICLVAFCTWFLHHQWLYIRWILTTRV
jgi:predicted permease